MSNREEVLTTGCRCDCGGSCLLMVHLKNGVITRIETDDGEEPQLRACLRCRAYRQRVYAPDRLLYPLKRVGERGEGKFQRISWDDALEAVAHEYRRVKETYGPAAVFYAVGGGDICEIHWQKPVFRVFSMAGGCTVAWGSASREGVIFAAKATYGTDDKDTGNTHDDYVNTKLVILWGFNPADTIHGSGTTLAMIRAREQGTRFVVVDPRFTDTAAALADRWIPVKPGTDTAVLLAMAYVMITENLHDQKFLNTYTVGFECFKEYVLGREDETPKTPYWAERISSVPAHAIAELARQYAATKPAALIVGQGPARSAQGEQYVRAGYVLAAMTGNIGIHGGNAGGTPPSGIPGGLVRPGQGIKSGGNPVDASSPLRPNFPRTSSGAIAARVQGCLAMDAFLKGKAGGYPSDYKMLYLLNSNWLNAMPDVNKSVRALKAAEFIAVQEQFMTATARFADVILPTCTHLERNDIAFGDAPHISFMRKVIEPMGESRSHLDIAIGLADKLGISNYDGKTEEEWLRRIAQPAVPDYEEFKRKGVHKFRLAKPHVAYAKQIADPGNNPFPTPSGKIEIYSRQLADMNDPMVPAIPKYIETWEGPNDRLARKYPLQLITTHFKRRAHSRFDNLPWLRELVPQAVMINSADAMERGIKNGDPVRVFNDRGEIVIPAYVTERIVPGAVDVPEGAWYNPGENGIDRGGCANVLTKDQPSPGGAFPGKTALVQVQKAQGTGYSS